MLNLCDSTTGKCIIAEGSSQPSYLTVHDGDCICGECCLQHIKMDIQENDEPSTNKWHLNLFGQIGWTESQIHIGSISIP